MHFFAFGSADEVRLSGQQTFRGGEPDKIFRRFDFALEVVVFRSDVCDRFGWRVWRAVANKGCVRLADIIDEVSDRLVERFVGKSLGCEGAQQNKSEQRARSRDHDHVSRYTALLQLMGRRRRAAQCEHRSAVSLPDKHARSDSNTRPTD
jgi:hypothetical protein